jgi:hypothetical protein
VITGEFEALVSPLLGLPISYLWQGHGSAIFLEFGTLRPHFLKNGKLLNHPCGDWTLGIEWSWRIEGKRRIWCGSGSEKERQSRVFSRLLGAKVKSVSLYGRLREIELSLSNGLRIVSFSTVEGNPEWGLIQRNKNGEIRSTGAVAGHLQFANETHV